MKVKFLKNTSYKGEVYGPDYDKDVADVDDSWAIRFKASGRCEEVAKKAPAKKAKTTKKAKSEDKKDDDK